MRNEYKILVPEPAGNTQFGRLSLRWMGSIKIERKEIQRRGAEWIHPA